MLDSIKKQNKSAYSLVDSDEIYSAHRPAPKRTIVSAQFAEELHAATIKFIADFKSVSNYKITEDYQINGEKIAYIFDGNTIHFNAVNGAERWSLEFWDDKRTKDTYKDVVDKFLEITYELLSEGSVEESTFVQ